MSNEQCGSGLGKQLGPGHKSSKQLRTVAYGGQHANSSHCIPVRLSAPNEAPSAERAGEHIQASSLTAKPTGTQQMCNVLSWG